MKRERERVYVHACGRVRTIGCRGSICMGNWERGKGKERERQEKLKMRKGMALHE